MIVSVGQYVLFLWVIYSFLCHFGQYFLFLWAIYSLLCQSLFYPKAISFFNFFIAVIYCMQATHYFTSILTCFFYMIVLIKMELEFIQCLTFCVDCCCIVYWTFELFESVKSFQDTILSSQILSAHVSNQNM